MTKFNKPTKLEVEPSRTINYEGGEAFMLSPKKELYQRVVTCLIEPKFYDTCCNDTIESISKLVKEMEEIDPEFVLKLASFARNEMYLRSIPIFLLVEACKHPKMKSYIRKWTPHIIKRVDELTEVIARYLEVNKIHIGSESPKGMLCNPLKRGIADTFPNFDEYQLAKYNRKRAVTLTDVIRITHPKPNSKKQSALWKRLIEDKLKVSETWETYISVHGSTKENWEHIMPKMPIMATLRNLRNFCKVNADISIALEKLTNKDVILRSKQFPFRFYSAYKMLSSTQIANYDIPKVLSALTKAIELSVDNLPRIKGKSLIVGDNSGSMTNRPISKNSIIYPRDISCLLLSIAHRICDESIRDLYSIDLNNLFSNLKS